MWIENWLGNKLIFSQGFLVCTEINNFNRNFLWLFKILKEFPEELRGDISMHLHREVLQLPIFESASQVRGFILLLQTYIRKCRRYAIYYICNQRESNRLLSIYIQLIKTTNSSPDFTIFSCSNAVIYVHFSVESLFLSRITIFWRFLHGWMRILEQWW